MRGRLGFLFVAYIMAYVVTGTPLLGSTWNRGGHPTPEQWAYHEVLERLGLMRHHGPRDAPRTDTVLSEAEAIGVPPPLAPQLVSAPTVSFVAGDGTQYYAAQALPPVGAAALSWQRVLADTAAATGLRPEPPDKPPRSHR